MYSAILRMAGTDSLRRALMQSSGQRAANCHFSSEIAPLLAGLGSLPYPGPRAVLCAERQGLVAGFRVILHAVFLPNDRGSCIAFKAHVHVPN